MFFLNGYVIIQTHLLNNPTFILFKMPPPSSIRFTHTSVCLFSFHWSIHVPLQRSKLFYVLTSDTASSPTVFFRIVLVILGLLFFQMDVSISIETFYTVEKPIIKNVVDANI